ncbi:tripartite tricarboxylate transporter substrate binding protein [Pigmentiphaga soli]|uniref:Tripartite tricarboxylate transporter substrate binding protein n=1 Tax=Pigmentiphaga soli TaxID=1007095 RepID=A0ABP8HRM6_9BURK
MKTFALLRGGLAVLAATAALALPAAAAQAEGFPARQVRLVVPFPPGGGSDTQARLLAERLGQLWKQTVVVDNVSGAGGGLAAANVAHARPDGYSVLFATHPMLAMYPFLYEKLPYDPVKDFAPVVSLLEGPLVLLVPASSPIRSVNDLIQAAKDKPGTINFGSGGVGTTQHLTGELLKETAGIKLTHVPYRGDGQSMTALISNEIQLLFASVSSATAQIKGGRVRGIAITDSKRAPSLPDIPTMAETIPGFQSTLVYGLLVPKDTPADIVDAINRAANQVLQDPAYARRVQADGVNVRGGTPEDFDRFLASERNKWGSLLKRLDIKMD